MGSHLRGKVRKVPGYHAVMTCPRRRNDYSPAGFCLKCRCPQQSPTGHIETPAALALIVFFSVHFYGFSVRGAGPYLRHYVQPTPFLLPLNLLSEITRIFSLMIRLFGNMMSHEFIIAILLLLAGLLLPIPFLLLGVLIGLIQAYIFTILASVYIAAAVGAAEV